jgi:TonB-dependent SusC/RagA subfamily outer membrane receptor
VIHHRVFDNLRFAMVATCLVASAGCFRHSAERDAGSAKQASSDSSRSANLERSRSSATQGISFDDAERARFTRVEQMIQARFSGVQVIPNAGNFTIQIRGTGSFGSTSNEPLVVIDGAIRTVRDLGSVHPREVMRIEVMKDAAASFYGARGANGVIVITTRRSG